ncbi:hypothetical protein LJR257_004683 [Ensifer adhaerens]
MLNKGGPEYLLPIIIAFLAAALVWKLYWFIRSLLFYRNNGWDFTVQFGPKMYKGEGDTPEFEMSAREKLVTGYPMGIVILGTLLTGFTIALFKS